MILQKEIALEKAEQERKNEELRRKNEELRIRIEYIRICLKLRNYENRTLDALKKD